MWAVAAYSNGMIIWGFASFPAIERLTHHDHSHPVAPVEQFRRRRIVAGADGVGPHFPQQRNLPFHRSHVDRSGPRRTGLANWSFVAASFRGTGYV